MQQVINKTEHEQVRSFDAEGMLYRKLNAILKGLNSEGIQKVKLRNVYGQRYIGTDLPGQMQIEISGTPGNDLGAFMNGPKITVYGNAQDGCGNTMNNGEIIIHGHAGDILGLSARGGKIFVRDDVGYRAGIHMKEYQDKRPIIVIGGTTQDFVGEYMGGGVLIMLGLNLGKEAKHGAKFIGTGMHGGVIYLRGQVEQYQLGREVGVTQLSEKDYQILHDNVSEFASHFNLEPDKIMEHQFIKLFPRWLRPYGRLYAY
jgi:glutamate synthase domain-containing protein 3